MRLRILAVGKLKESYLRDGVKDFAARMRPYAKLEIVEIPALPDPAQFAPGAVARIREEEAEQILRRWEPGETLIAMDPHGKQLTSEGLAEFLRAYDANGTPLAIAIGGSWGLGQEVLDRAAAALSLSAMTFPHGLARLILLEQLYRAFKILRGETYHK